MAASWGAKGYIGTGGKVVWRIDRGTPDVPSPVIYNNLVYLCRENGTATVSMRRPASSSIRVASPPDLPRLTGGRRRQDLYTSRDGMVTVLQAGREFKVLAKNKLAGGLIASPAPSNGRIYLHPQALYAIGEK